MGFGFRVWGFGCRLWVQGSRSRGITSGFLVKVKGLRLET